MFSKKIIWLFVSQFAVFSVQAVPVQEQWVPAQDEPFVAKRPPLKSLEGKQSEESPVPKLSSAALPTVNASDSEQQYWTKRGRLDIVDRLRKAQRDTTPQPASVRKLPAEPSAGSVALVPVAPLKTESTEPLKAEPARLAQVKAEPVKPVPLKTEPVKPEPVKAALAKPIVPLKVADTKPEMAAELIMVQPLTPTREEQSRYWSARGRGDLAAKIAAPLDAHSESGNANGDRPVTIDRVRARPAQTAASSVGKLASDEKNTIISVPYIDSAGQDTRVPSKLTPEELAKYWAARGRDDLAEQAQNMSHPLPAGEEYGSSLREFHVKQSVREDKVIVRGAEQPARSEQLTPNKQELADSAEYWSSRGCTDLAEALQSRLEVPAARRGSVRVVPVAQAAMHEKPIKGDNKSALEDVLLKSPTSIKARLDLADIYRQAGELGRAAVLIDSVLAGHPDLAEALFARARLYAEQSLWREVLGVLEKVSPSARNAEMARLQKTAWAHVQIDRADALLRQGNQLEAQVLLRQVARELALNEQQRVVQPESPSLWKNAAGSRGAH